MPITQQGLKKMNLDIDLNLPAIQNHDEGTSNNLAWSQAMPVTEEGFVRQMVFIDIISSDDEDVILSSPRSFAEAQNNSRRKRGGIAIGVNADKNGGESEEQAAPPSPPKEPIVYCPICLEPAVEETSTKCGHIFCQGCIRTAVAVKKSCPTCRKRLTKRDMFRVFLVNNSRI